MGEQMLRIGLTAVCALALTLAGVGSASANTIFSGSSGSLSASANFGLSGNTLTIILTNTSLADVLVPADVLTGFFFDTAHTLTAVSASLNGSTVNYGSLVTDVGEGWQYKGGVSAQGKNAGISAAGLGIFGPTGNFFTPGVSSDGLDYGILSAGDDLSTGNTGVTGHGPLIKNSLTFTLSAAAGFSLNELGSSVVFQFGTALDEPHFTGDGGGGGGGGGAVTPEPATFVLVGGALALAGIARGRKPSRR